MSGVSEEGTTCVSFMEKMERQWTERKLGLEPVTASASARLTVNVDRVWEFLMAPELAHLTELAVVSAFRVPGTPVGEVGEQQCYIQDTGEDRRSVTLLKFIELERPFRMVVRFPTSPTKPAPAPPGPAAHPTVATEPTETPCPLGTGHPP